MSEKYAKFLESPFNNIPPLSYDNHPRESGEPFFKVAFEVNVRQDWGGGEEAGGGSLLGKGHQRDRDR